MDENAISVRCAIEGCNARVHGDVKCREHGGDPFYEWRTSDFGEATYYVKKTAFVRSPITGGAPSEA